ncbi:MAG: hypothetical protein AAFP15_00285 [Bacteroidota bacterium]
MNRVALLAVAAATIWIGSLSSSSLERTRDIATDTEHIQSEMLAERVARTGLDLAASKINQDFEGWRAGFNQTAHNGGTFEVVASGGTAGPVVLASTGDVSGTSVDIYRVVGRLASAPSPLMLDSDTMQVNLSGTNFLASGHDTPSFSYEDLPEGYGRSGTSVPAVWTSTPEGQQTVQNALSNYSSDRVRGDQSQADVTTGALAYDVEAILDEVMANPAYAYQGNQSFQDTAFGSLGSPTTVYIDGDVSFAGATTGYGILVVEGDFVAAGDFEWHGVVVADKVGDMEVTLRNNATIYGMLYVRHEEGDYDCEVEVGDAEVDPMTIWSIRDSDGMLMRYTIDEDQVIVGTEGLLQGIQEPATPGFTVDAEAFTFGPDGTIYFVNNANFEEYTYSNGQYYPVQDNALYTIDPAEIDDDPSTPVNVTRVGDTGRYWGDEINSLVFQGNTLYGFARSSTRLYELDLSTGNASQVRRLVSGTAEIGSFTMNASGQVYFTRTDASSLELWRWDDLVTGWVAKQYDLSGISHNSSDKMRAIAAHPDGMIYGHDGVRFVRVDPTNGGVTQLSAYSGDIQDMAFYFQGEEATAENVLPGCDQDLTGIIPDFTSLPYDWMGNTSYAQYSTLNWPGGPGIQVRVDADTGYGSYYRAGYAEGMSLQALTESVDLGQAASDINNPDYIGPNPLPVLDVHPPMYSSGGGRAEVSFTFSQAWNRPFYFYIFDIDNAATTIRAYDENGAQVSTADWEMTQNLDVLLGSDGSSDGVSWIWDASRGSLRPEVIRDTELIVAELMVPNFSEVREIRISLQTANMSYFADRVSYSFAPLSLFKQRGILDFTMADNAEVYYSTEALGQLATLSDTIEQGSWIVEYDDYTMDLRDYFEEETFVATPQREDERRVAICRNGRSVMVSVLGLSGHLDRGATLGRCGTSSSGGEAGEPTGGGTQSPVTNPLADPTANGPGGLGQIITICVDGVEMQIELRDLATWQRRGASIGSCTVAAE